MSALTETAFNLLLIRLEKDESIFPLTTRAAEKYELLRQKLVKCLMWKGCSETDADSLADTVLDRVALKLEKGEDILNFNAYIYGVLRLVWLEYFRKTPPPPPPPPPPTPPPPTPMPRMLCLRKCLTEVVPNVKDSQLILRFYDNKEGEKLKEARKRLAEELGMSSGALKTKACYLRQRLERCINECVARLSVTKTPISDTNKQGGDVQ